MLNLTYQTKVTTQLDLRTLPVQEWPEPVQAQAIAVLTMIRQQRQQDLFLRELVVARVEDILNNTPTELW